MSTAAVSSQNLPPTPLRQNLCLLPDHKLLLGELQLAFVCFLVCNVYDAFEHWKLLVDLLCSCDAALASHSALYLEFLSQEAGGRWAATTIF